MLRYFCDEDGKLQVSRVESFVAKGYSNFQVWRQMVLAQLEKPVVCGGVGIAVLLYGGHFKTTAVVAQSLKSFDYEELQERWNALRREYRRVRADGQLAADAIAIDAGREADAPHAPQLAALALRARPLLDNLQRLQYSVIGLVAMALNENSARLGLGIQLGVHLTRLVGPRLEALLVGEEDSDESGQLRPYGRMAIDCLCTVSGLALAWALKGWAALWTACGLGAQLCMQSLPDSLLPAEESKREFAVGCLTAAGFAWQAQYWGKPPQPWPLFLVFGPARMLEHGLSSLA
jgi:hypothetical protein